MVSFENSMRIRTEDCPIVIAVLSERVDKLTRTLDYTARRLEEKELEAEHLRVELERMKALNEEALHDD